MASAKIAKVKKQIPKKVVDTEADGEKKLNDYEILTTIGKMDFCFITITCNIYCVFHGCKNDNFQMKNSDIFLFLIKIHHNLFITRFVITQFWILHESVLDPKWSFLTYFPI